MRKTLLCTAIGILIAAAAIAQTTTKPTTPAAPAMNMNMTAAAPADLKWGPVPPVFEPNAQMAVVSGDPSKPGPYVVRMKAPAGYKIMPHYHPTDENVTVISGTFALGMGDKMDTATMRELPAGSFALLPAQMHHYAMAKTECIVQVHGVGPFSLTYVDPADDPSTRASAKK